MSQLQNTLSYIYMVTFLRGWETIAREVIWFHSKREDFVSLFFCVSALCEFSVAGLLHPSLIL